jgi:hypothetical protein
MATALLAPSCTARGAEGGLLPWSLLIGEQAHPGALFLADNTPRTTNRQSSPRRPDVPISLTHKDIRTRIPGFAPLFSA